jgi:hypothetical protein
MMKNPRYAERTALFIADSYWRSGNRAYQREIELKNSELKPEHSGAVYMTLSSYAFALEAYMKLMIYCFSEKTKSGHDLAKLWKQLPKAARNWLDKNFEKNYKSKGGDWAASVKFGDLSKDEESNIKFSTQTNTAHGMIKAHKNAFEDGRYGFEFKKKSKVIVYCLPGINMLTYLTRGLAHHVFNERQKFVESKKGLIGKHIGSINMPGSISEITHKDLS